MADFLLQLGLGNLQLMPLRIDVDVNLKSVAAVQEWCRLIVDLTTGLDKSKESARVVVSVLQPGWLPRLL